MVDRPRLKTLKAIRACDVCRRKKIKCDTASPQCSNCITHNSECTFTHIEQPRAAPQRRRKDDSHHLEARIKRMEEFIRQLGMTFDDNQHQSHLPLTTFHHHRSERDDIPGWLAEARPSTAQPQRMILPEYGSYARSSDSLPESFVDGLHDRPRLRSSLSATEISSANNPLSWNLHSAASRSREHVYLQLPPIGETLFLLQIYFEHFNFVFPLFDQPSVMSRVVQRFIQHPGTDLVWWGALNVMLSLAFRLQAMSTSINGPNDENSWGYLQNALSIVTDLTFCDTELLGVQTLLGVAISLQGTFNPRTESILIATAIKLLHQLGLQKDASTSSGCAIPAHQRNRILWIAYILDKDFSLQLDHPPLLHDDDLDVEVPSEGPSDGLGFVFDPVGSEKINLFRLRVHLAIIQDKIYSRLYSTQALRLPRRSRCQSVQDLSNMPERWKVGVPLTFRPESLSTCLPKSSLPHLVILHLSHFHCLTMIHGVHAQSEDWVNLVLHPEAQDQSRGYLWRSLGNCMPAARNSVRLVRLLPQGDFACIWLLLNPIISGLAIILASIIRQPHKPLAFSDMDLIEPTLRLVDLLAENRNAKQMSSIRAICANLETRAKSALDQAATQAAT